MIHFSEVCWVDVKPYLLSRQQPVFMLDRPLAHDGPKAWAGPSQVARLGEFWVPETSLLGDGVKWAVTRLGDKVRVPIVAYKAHRSLSGVWGLAMQIGLAAMADLRNHTSDPPTSITLVLSDECTDLLPGEAAYRCYAGIAIRTK